MKQGNTLDFTEGKIMGSLTRFALPILLSQFLQAMYGAVDLAIVGKFCDTADISGVSNGGQLMHGMLSLFYGFAIAVTVILGQKIGQKDKEGVKKTLSSGIVFFILLGIVSTLILLVFTEAMVRLMNVPTEAHDATYVYIRICGAGSVFILAYNLLGSIFRGIGDSKTPLITVAIATVVNIIGDLVAVGIWGWGAAGAAAATVAAQFVSVVLSLLMISRKKDSVLELSVREIRPEKGCIRSIVKVGTPISLQETLVTLSFLAITIIVNELGVEASAGAGVAGRVCTFIMLLASACSAALSAFTAQNVGAGKHERARTALKYLIGASFAVSIFLAYVSYFHGDLLVHIFTDEELVVAQAWDYLRAYAIDSLLTAFLFCFLGYYNGYAQTTFVMLQGLIGAFGVRIPVAFLMSRSANPTLFKVALATPCSTVVQIILCFIFYGRLKKKLRSGMDMTV